VSNGDRLRILLATKELAGFTATKLQDLLPFVDELCVPAGAELAREGQLCHQLLIVAEGLLATRGKRGSGRLGPGDTFGWTAMQDRGQNDATVEALSPAYVLVMSHQQFRAVEGLARCA